MGDAGRITRNWWRTKTGETQKAELALAREAAESPMGQTGGIARARRRTDIGEKLESCAVIGAESGGVADGTDWSHRTGLAAK